MDTCGPGSHGGEAGTFASDTVVVSFTAAPTEGHAVPKAIKGNASRKPPEPAKNHSDIDDWFGRQMPHRQPIVKKLDETIRATIPGLHCAVKWKRPYYGLPELGGINEMAAYDVSVHVVFLGGADFDRPPPLGTTDRTQCQYLRFEIRLASQSLNRSHRLCGALGTTRTYTRPSATN